MAYFHQNLSQEKWNGLSEDKQILNIAAELTRARNFLVHVQDNEYFMNSLNRALELVDLTVNNREQWENGKLRELLRFRENLASYSIAENRDIDYFQKLLKAFLYLNKQSALIKL